MKLRMKGDSLRLRLTRGEVQQLAQAGRVEEHVHIGERDVLTYRLQSTAAATAIGARLASGLIVIELPEDAARQWCTSDLVTLEHVQRQGASALHIVVEKDFACLAPRTDEDESDHFAHPKARSPEA